MDDDASEIDHCIKRKRDKSRSPATSGTSTLFGIPVEIPSES